MNFLVLDRLLSPGEFRFVTVSREHNETVARDRVHVQSNNFSPSRWMNREVVEAAVHERDMK